MSRSSTVYGQPVDGGLGFLSKLYFVVSLNVIIYNKKIMIYNIFVP